MQLERLGGGFCRFRRCIECNHAWKGWLPLRRARQGRVTIPPEPITPASRPAPPLRPPDLVDLAKPEAPP